MVTLTKPRLLQTQATKLGRIFDPDGRNSWIHSHAALPTVHERNEGIFDVYFCARDELSRSQIGRFTFDIEQPAETLYVSTAPLLSVGALGAFDDSGVTPASIVADGSRLWLYYTGWMLGQTVPFYYAVGLAVSDDAGQTFHRVSRGPVLERNDVDPYLIASPCVLHDVDRWRMWYVSGVRWELCNGRPRHYYHIKYAESDDGVRWRRDGRVCIDFASDAEYAIARPSVIFTQGRYQMWFPHRGTSYRIGFADSQDGLTWQRRDELSGIDVSQAGWDSEMVTYPSVFAHRGSRYMLYNGNGYGQTGIGLAQLH